MLDFGEVDGEFFLAMELIVGFDLRAVLNRLQTLRQALPPTLVCHVITELASALGYAHALVDDDGHPRDIVHRDVTPSDIMLTKLGDVKLLDFGIAKAADHIRDEKTRTGTLKGKLSYMSPEQAEALPVDRRSDVFALGIDFWECLTMRRLFISESDLLTLRKVRENQVARASSLASGIDPDVETIVMKMLAHAPEDRFASCDEVVAALGPITHRLNGNASGLQRLLAGLDPLAPVIARASEAPTTPSIPHDMAPSSANEALRPPTLRKQRGKRSARSLLWGAAAIAVGLVAPWSVRPAPAPVAPVPVAPVMNTTGVDTEVAPIKPARAAETRSTGDTQKRQPRRNTRSRALRSRALR